MAKVTNLDVEYAGLMSHNPEGTYLYIPPSFAALHPGSVGFFDQRGSWNPITDLSKKGRSETGGYTKPSHDLSYDEPTTSAWKARSSEPEDGHQARINGGTSDDPSVGANCESKSSVASSGKAGLAVKGFTRREKIRAPFFNPSSVWASENVETILSKEFATHIEKNGLWVIQSTWVAEECAIRMTDRADKSVEVGLDIVSNSESGAVPFDKLKSEGWSTYHDAKHEGGRVVSFSGLHFKPSQFQKSRQGLHEDVSVGHMNFESVMVGQTLADAEEEKAAEIAKGEKVKAEVGARKTAIHRNTEVSDDVVPH